MIINIIIKYIYLFNNKSFIKNLLNFHRDVNISQMSKNIYLRFLTLLQTIEGKGELPSLDLDAKKLLETIAVQHFQGKSLTVTEAMTLSHIASPATIHRKLNVLREIGLIETLHEGKNRRTKYLVPTAQANRYFDEHSNIMHQALAPLT